MIITDLYEAPQLCPECGGISFSDLILAEKKDACYYKVKASAKVWPSAYASGRLVQCRKKGADNWGNKSEGMAESQLNELFDMQEEYFKLADGTVIRVEFRQAGLNADAMPGSINITPVDPKIMPMSGMQAIQPWDKARQNIRMAIQKWVQSGQAKPAVSEMDKSAPQPGRDGKVSHKTYGSRDNYKLGDPERTGKPISTEKAKKDALDILKKQGVAEGMSQTPFTDEELVAINQYLDDDLSFQELKTYPGLIRKIAKYLDIASIQGHMGEMNFYDRLVQAREEGDIPQQGVAEGSFGSGYGSVFTLYVNTGEKPATKTKTKKFKREDDAVLWAEDYADQHEMFPNLKMEIQDENGNVVWELEESQGVAEEGERGRGRPTTGEWDPTSGKVGRTEKTAQGIRHHADPSRYGGSETEPELDRLDKNKVNAMDKALGVKWDRESKRYYSPIKVDETKPKEKEADYGDDYQAMVARVKKLAGLGPLKTVYDPQKRVYRNVPTAVQPKK